MITVERFRAEHVAEMTVQPAQRADWAAVTPDMLRAFEQTDAWTVRAGGEVVLVGGLVEVWPGRATLWSYVGAGAGPYMTRLTRGVRRLMDASNYTRIEVYVDANFEGAHRWARLLGFACESIILRAFFPDGRDGVIYGRVR